MGMGLVLVHAGVIGGWGAKAEKSRWIGQRLISLGAMACLAPAAAAAVASVAVAEDLEKGEEDIQRVEVDA